MKHLLYTMCALALTSSMYAQTGLQKEDLKVGNNNLEVTFNPFASDSKTFKLNSGALKYRRFFGDNALRVNLGLGVNNDILTNTVSSPDKPDDNTPSSQSTIYKQSSTVINKTKTNEIRFKLTAGYERHLDLNRRMSMYFGGEIGYEGARNTTTIDDTKNNSNITQTWNSSSNAYYTSSESSNNYTSTTKQRNDNGFNALVLGAFTGIDFYVYKNLYVGLELGLEFNHRSYLLPCETSFASNSIVISKEYDSNGKAYVNTKNTITVEEKDSKTVTTTTFNDYITNDSRTETQTAYSDIESNSRATNEFKIDVNPALRFGWRF